MSSTPESRRPQFRTTAWTEVLLAAREAKEHDTEAAGALDRLCRDYWYPIYAFIRRQGHEPAAAEDLAQGFFLKLLDKRYLDDADRTRGKFRTFLLASVKHFLANEHDRASAQKRGGGKQIFSLDFAEAERKYASSTTDNWTAEALFDRQWALALLDRVLIGLGESYDAAGKGSLFVALRGRILDASAGDSLSSIAAELQTTTGALKVALHRLRKDYRQRLVEEVAATVGSGDDVDDERSQLMDALAGGKL